MYNPSFDDQTPSVLYPVEAGTVSLVDVKKAASRAFEQWEKHNESAGDVGDDLSLQSIVDLIERDTFPTDDEQELNNVALLIGELLVREAGGEWTSYISKKNDEDESLEIFGVFGTGGTEGLSVVGN
ncbi:hypothetical protein [Corynebacterium glutamicum]|uniref:hypothetical protein n=1 Tax=Corynebacterium glutamicum TaxID=1718 RepID=UPI0000236C5E|nr:hypothetical protein [Corynebacterium glutamicum]NII96612.1 hypothetical protein [Corynebacterium glutamicum]WBG73414.1 hypothetical protein O5J82_08440 [Corynebacterium glutamicum]CAF20068.1 hypothetical protein predicted by Glimmer/Critica [Corynebacterium glutamicum ATCC 13032]